MELPELYLNRFLYRDASQDAQGAAFTSWDSTPEEPEPIPSGGAAQDINTSNVLINGAVLEPGTFPSGVLDVSNWGWGQTSVFSSTDSNTVSWGAGTFTSADGNSYSISAGNTGNMSAKTYIYLDLLTSETEYQITTTSANSVGIGKVLIAVAENATPNATYNLSEATQIVGDNILANTIDASKMNVGQLSAITADIGSITSGTITGALLRTSVSGERIEIDDDSIESFDTGGTRRTLIKNSGMVFYGEDGNSAATIFGVNNDELGIYVGSQLYELDDNGFRAVGLFGSVGSLGTSGEPWNTGYIDNLNTDELDVDDGLTLGGVRRTSWPTSGVTTLSGLSINTSKNWGGYSLTNVNNITITGDLTVGDDILGANRIEADIIDLSGGGYIDDARAFYFETGRSTNPSISGEIRYFDSGTKGFRGYVNGFRGQFDMTAV